MNEDNDSLGIFDIGSNSVRFVTYDLNTYPPRPFFNEKVTCGLGRRLEKDGMLSRRGTKRALKALAGFLILAEALNVKNIKAIATAATRDAKDGEEFTKKIKKKLDLDVQVLSGEEEARYSAYGIIADFPGASGVAADLGGGSLELAAVENDATSKEVSLPLGVLRLKDRKKKALSAIEGHLDTLMPDYKGCKNLYAIGGTWRAFSEAWQISQGIKIPHSHGHEMAPEEILAFTRTIEDVSPSKLIKRYGVEKKRANLLFYAALALSYLCENLQPEKVVFSNAGLRDGIVYEIMRDKREQS